MPYGIIKVDTVTFTDNGVDKNISLSGLVQNPTFTGNVTATGTISGDIIRGGTTISGVTVTGTTANFVSGVFTTQLSGVTITGTTAATTTGTFISLTGTTATFTSGIIASGTAALPSLAILSDPNTGIFSPGADQLAVATNGVERVEFGASEVVFNDGGTDYDFRVESDLESQLFFIDASDNSIGVGTAGNYGDGAILVAALNRATGAGTANVRLGIGVKELTSGLGRGLWLGARTDENTGVIGTRTASGNLAFETYNGSWGERMRLTYDGRLGIGTSSPGGKLDVRDAGTTIPALGAVGTGLNVRRTDGAIGLIIGYENTIGGSYIQAQHTNGSATAYPLYLQPNGGNVGIGTTSPGYALDVQGNIGATISSKTAEFNAAGSSIYASFNDGTKTWRAGVGILGAGLFTIRNHTDAVNPITITAAGNVGIDTLSPATDVLLTVGGTDTNCGIMLDRSAGDNCAIYNQGGELVFKNGSSSTVGGLSDRGRFDSSGRLLVGTSTSLQGNSLVQIYKASGSAYSYVDVDTLPDGDDAGFYAAGGNRDLQLTLVKHSGITNPVAVLQLQPEDGTRNYYWTDNSDQFRISTTPSHVGTTSGTVVGTQSSDERLKNILGPVEYGLGTIKQIEPVRYALKTEPDTEKLGFIAQQVQPLVPQSVFDTKDHIEGEPEDAPTKLGMEYVALIPVLVNAIKELSAEVDALKAQLS